MTSHNYPVTPDGRYFLVGGRLWRATNPAIAGPERDALVGALMDARRAVKKAKRGNGDLAQARARAEICQGNVALRQQWDELKAILDVAMSDDVGRSVGNEVDAEVPLLEQVSVKGEPLLRSCGQHGGRDAGKVARILFHVKHSACWGTAQVNGKRRNRGRRDAGNPAGAPQAGRASPCEALLHLTG